MMHGTYNVKLTMGRFLHNDKMQYTCMCCNLKPSRVVMCTHCVLKWIPVFRLNTFKTSRRRQRTYNSESRILNFKLIFVVFLRNLQCMFCNKT